MPEQTEPLPHAKEVLSGLQAQLRDAKGRLERIASSRKALAYDAGTGNAQARRKQNDLQGQAKDAETEIENLEAAIVEATRRVGVATAASTAARLRAQASNALPLCKRLRAAGARAHAAVGELGAALADLRVIFIDLRRCGVRMPGAELVKVNMKRAIRSALMPLGLADPLPPSQRIGFDTVIGSYATKIETAVSKIAEAPDDQLARLTAPKAPHPFADADTRGVHGHLRPPAYENDSPADVELLRWMERQTDEAA